MLQGEHSVIEISTFNKLPVVIYTFVLSIIEWPFYTGFTVSVCLSHDVAPGSEITPCNKIDKPLVVYRFTGNVMTSITTMRT